MNKPVYLILFILIVLSLQSCTLYNAARHPTPEVVNKASADRMKLFKNIKKIGKMSKANFYNFMKLVSKQLMSWNYRL